METLIWDVSLLCLGPFFVSRGPKLSGPGFLDCAVFANCETVVFYRFNRPLTANRAKPKKTGPKNERKISKYLPNRVN